MMKRQQKWNLSDRYYSKEGGVYELLLEGGGGGVYEQVSTSTLNVYLPT
jgi:hypothetical protein